MKKISSDKNIPIMYITFDTQNSDTGLETRLEAFYDMLCMNKEKNKILFESTGEILDG